MGQDTNCYFGASYECKFNTETLSRIIKMIDSMEKENAMFIYMVDDNYVCTDITEIICDTIYVKQFTQTQVKNLKCYNKIITIHYVIEDFHVRGLCRYPCAEYLLGTYMSIDGLHKKIDNVVDKFALIGVNKEELNLSYRFRDSQ